LADLGRLFPYLRVSAHAKGKVLQIINIRQKRGNGHVNTTDGFLMIIYTPSHPSSGVYVN
jgi:hypothetical protein